MREGGRGGGGINGTLYLRQGLSHVVDHQQDTEMVVCYTKLLMQQLVNGVDGSLQAQPALVKHVLLSAHARHPRGQAEELHESLHAIAQDEHVQNVDAALQKAVDEGAHLRPHGRRLRALRELPDDGQGPNEAE